jgi:Leucine-rich repeat (LRR) protein
MNVEPSDHVLPALLPYLDRANEYTGDSLVLPILKFVFGDRKLSPETNPEELSPAEREVLLHLFNNLKLWATNMSQDMFDVTGLGIRRTDWARVLRTEARFSDAQIVEILEEKSKQQRCSRPEDLKELRLCRIGSPEFLPHLRSYANLKILDFADTSLDDGDLAQLAEFGGLQLLRLNGTNVTDVGIQHLVDLSHLEELYLPGTKVTDDCLESLGQLPKLRYVSLSNTSVTNQAANKFMEQHPACRISR